MVFFQPVPILVSNFTRFYAREADNVRLHGEFHHVSQCPSRTGPFYDGDSKGKHHAHGPMTKKSEIGTAVESRNFQQVYSSSDSDFETLKKMPGRGLHVKSSVPVTVTESAKVLNLICIFFQMAKWDCGSVFNNSLSSLDSSRSRK